MIACVRSERLLFNIKYYIHSFIQLLRSTIAIFSAHRADIQTAKKPLPVMRNGPMYVQTPAVITHNTNNRTAVSFMTFFAISLYIPIRYAQTIKVIDPAAIDNPAPSKRSVFFRNGLMEASIVTIEQNTRFIMYFTSLDWESYRTKSSPMHHWHEDMRPPQAPNHPFDV
mmetsp:Transcript_18942/g.31037  ORF Transcript_18942/g.31037 Transcript_18942/m.31037 type:complete len:169 (+) Transcript_18942:900-1406(+)